MIYRKNFGSCKNDFKSIELIVPFVAYLKLFQLKLQKLKFQLLSMVRKKVCHKSFLFDKTENGI